MAECTNWKQDGMSARKVELWMSGPTLSCTGVAIGHDTDVALSYKDDSVPFLKCFASRIMTSVEASSRRESGFVMVCIYWHNRQS
mmetsp:Transcript_9568/g.28714  ORF Transcript_9568/g.28714 Transcript_9568/m.28714 type:complete len:85 (+) Transcript_9568:451-705(+)